MKRIIIERGKINEVARVAGVTRQTVYKALRGNQSVINVAKIRAIALEKGGVEIG